MNSEPSEYRVEIRKGRWGFWHWEIIHDDYGGLPITAAKGVVPPWSIMQSGHDGALYKAHGKLAKLTAKPPPPTETMRGDELMRKHFR